MLIVSVSIGAFNYHTHHRPIKPKWLDFYDIQVSSCAIHVSNVCVCMCAVCAVCAYVCMYVYMHVCCVCLCAYVRMYACVPMCVCLPVGIPYGPISELLFVVIIVL